MSGNHNDQADNYFMYFYYLLLLTVLTVGISYLTLGSFMAVFLAVAVASVKATIVLWNFMHLKHEVNSIYVAVIVPIVLTAILVVALLPDFF